jgi:hypothetical protein
VEAELRTLCTPRSNETRRLSAPEPTRTALVIQPTHLIRATGYNASAAQQPRRANGTRAESGRRRAGQGDVLATTYAVDCWAAVSAFSNGSKCNCLGKPAHPKLGSRRTIRILLASWYPHCSSWHVCAESCCKHVLPELQPGNASTVACVRFGMHPLCAG